MSKPLLPKKKVDAISNGLFLIGLGALFYFNAWWPGILLALWVMLATRQVLSGRQFDFIISSVVLLGLFVIAYFRIDFSILMPALFVLGGLYIIFREYFYTEDKEDSSDK